MRTIELSKDKLGGRALCGGAVPHSVGGLRFLPGGLSVDGPYRRQDEAWDLCLSCWEGVMEWRRARNAAGAQPPYQILNFWEANRSPGW